MRGWEGDWEMGRGEDVNGYRREEGESRTEEEKRIGMREEEKRGIRGGEESIRYNSNNKI